MIIDQSAILAESMAVTFTYIDRCVK